jgi:hypothetical protein
MLRKGVVLGLKKTSGGRFFTSGSEPPPEASKKMKVLVTKRGSRGVE